MATVLITGANGGIGKVLTQHLLSRGHAVKTLSTRLNNKEVTQKSYLWNLNSGFIEQNALDGVEIIIHLAGANIGNHRWTKAYKEEIISSRTESARLLLEAVQHQNIQLKKFIGMAGTGFYADPSSAIADEQSPAGKGFVAEVCVAWEEASLAFKKTGAEVVIARTAPVLQKNSGLLDTYLMTSGLRIIPTTGSRANKLNWIHIDDLIQFMTQAVEQTEITGTYNLCSPEVATQYSFVKAIDKALGHNCFHPNVPAFILKMALGERAALPLTNQHVRPKRLLDMNFSFLFPDIESALYQLLSSKNSQI